MSRQKVKRKLLDELDARPQVRSAAEPGRGRVRQRLENHPGRSAIAKRTFEDEGTTEEKAKDEYRGIAERRVRLGLVLAEIGERNKIKVSDDELTRAMMERPANPRPEQRV